MALLSYFLSSAESESDFPTPSGQDDAERQSRDTAWLHDIANGDEQAFKALYLAYYHLLHTFATTFLHSSERAEEVIHDVFVWLWDHRTTMEIQNLRAYLFRAVRRRAIDVTRNIKAVARADREAVARDVMQAADAITPASDAPDRQVMSAEIRAALEDVIHQMPPGRATAARLRWVDGLPVADIAHIMEISVSAAQMQVLRAKEDIAVVLRRFL